MKHRIALMAGLFVLSALAGVLTATSPARGDSEAEVPLPRDFQRLIPPYPGAAYRAAGDQLAVEGIRRKLAYSETDDAPPTVLRRYRDALEGRGLTVRDYGDGLTAGGDGWLRTIVVTGRAEGSLIVASLRREDTSVRGALLPIPATCARRDDASSRDGTTGRSVTNLVCDGYVAELRAYYESLMGKEAAFVHDDGLAHVLRFERDGEELTVTMAQLPGDPPRVAASLYWEAR